MPPQPTRSAPTAGSAAPGTAASPGAAAAPGSAALRQATLDDVNALDAHGFVALFGGVFERSPWVVERAWASRPFASAGALHAAMTRALREAPRAEQLALLCAHPELAGREAREGTLTAASGAEQASAGLTALSREEMERIASLNRAYREKFGHPFIVAVRLHTKQRIFAEFERRLALDGEAEFANCIEQVCLITRLRLEQVLAPG